VEDAMFEEAALEAAPPTPPELLEFVLAGVDAPTPLLVALAIDPPALVPVAVPPFASC
jgi:hypothetical protein